MFDAGLVLEGGGMRGVYTAGVLDFFLENDIFFQNLYGVSAGACHACSYLSKQKGRGFEITVDYLKDKRYCSFYSLITTGDMFGVKMCYDLIPNILNPYDYDTFLKAETNFYTVVTNCKTGQAEYLKVNDLKKDMDVVRASSSLPLLSRIVTVNKTEYLDGGVADSIPLKKSRTDGNKKSVVILTRPDGYKKGPNKLVRLMKLKYKKYPELVKAIERRHIEYNETLEFVSGEVFAGNVFVIKPSVSLQVKRTEKNREKLFALYNLGYNDARKAYFPMLSFLGEKTIDYNI